MFGPWPPTRGLGHDEAGFISTDWLARNTPVGEATYYLCGPRPSLIYELLPGVEGLPHRLSHRARASHLTARLNYDGRSSRKGLIHQHTNPGGIILNSSTASGS